MEQLKQNYYGSLCTEMYEILHKEPPKDELEFYLSYAEKDMKILEALCGSGRFFLPFYERGFDISGIDLSEEMLRKLREKAPDAKVIQADILKCDIEEKFDYIFICASSVALFTDIELCKQILAKLRGMLKSGGKLVFSVDTIENKCEDDSDYEVIYEIGDKVKIKNSIYTVMGYVDIPDTVLGSIPEESAPLTQGFVMSTNSFMKLHGEPSIYQSFINVSDNKNRKIQKLLNEFQKDNANLDVKSKQTYAREFQMQIFSQTALGYMMSIIVGLIGIMNYINTAASSIISRRHEFVILHSIGMTKRQLKNMLLLENIYIVSLVSIFSIMLSSVLGRTFVKSIIETSWCSSYRFAVWPLFAVLLLYFGISIIMPLLLIKNQEGESIVFRMKQLTDSY